MKKYLEDFHKMKLFRLQDAVQIVGNEKSAKDLLRNYRKQQLICQIRRNLYTVTDLAWIGSSTIFRYLRLFFSKIYSIRFRRHPLSLL